MVELDANRIDAAAVPYDTSMSLWAMTKRYGFHFTSLIAVIIFMIVGYSPMLSVFYSTVLCLLFSAMTPETALGPRNLLLPMLVVAVVGSAFALAVTWLSTPGATNILTAAANVFVTYFP